MNDYVFFDAAQAAIAQFLRIRSPISSADLRSV
jgi:hypothetical protein